MLAREASGLSDQVTGVNLSVASWLWRQRLGRSGVVASAVPMPMTATLLASTCSAVSRCEIPPVSIRGTGLVVASSAANSRKYASRAAVRPSTGRPVMAGLS